MSGDDARDEGTWLDDMPARVFINEPRQSGKNARLAAAIEALTESTGRVARVSSRADEDARAAVRRIGVER